MSCTDEQIDASEDLISQEKDGKRIKTSPIVRFPISDMTGQLNELLGQNDSYEYDVAIDDDFSLVFYSVHEFYLFKKIVAYKIPGHSLNPFQYEHIVRFSLIYNEESFLNIVVQHKLESEDDEQQYTLVDLTSSFNSAEAGQSWQELNSSYYVFGGIATINLTGRMSYKCIISGIPIIYHDSKFFSMTLDIHTGTPLSLFESIN